MIELLSKLCLIVGVIAFSGAVALLIGKMIEYGERDGRRE